MTYSSSLTLALWAFMILLTLSGTALTLVHFLSRRSRVFGASDSVNPFPPVSILKPLKGAENGMALNLESFFKIDYPAYEVIFSIADARDPARALVQECMRQYPEVDARLIVGEVQVGPNPKVNNLVQSYQVAKHDVTLISDSNVRVAPDYLTRLVGDLDLGTGVVTGVVAGQMAQGVGGHLEATFLNTFYARWMVLSARLGWPTCVGKSMLFRRTTMDRFGGIQNMGRYLAEDYMTGAAMQKLGLRVKIMRDPVNQIIGAHTFDAFWNRHIRWGRIRKSQTPLTLFFEPLCGALLSGAMGAWSFYKLWGISPLSFLAAHLAVWFVCDALVMKALKAEVKLYTPAIWLAREVLSLPHWVHILSGNTVNWRGNRLKLNAGGVLAPQANTARATGGIN